MAFELVNSNTSIIDDSNFSNYEAEIALIGCILWDNRNYEKISEFLHEDHFVDPNNKTIFKTIRDLLDKNILVSPITLKNYLPEDDNKLDHVKYLNQIKDSTPSTQNAFNYAKLVYDLHLKRNLLGIAHRIIEETNSNEENLDGNSLIENAENDLYLLSQIGNADRKHVDFATALKNAVDIISEAFKRDGKIAGVPTGFKDLDKKLGGLHRSDLIIVAGRPSMGKTALGTNIAFNCAIKYREVKDEFENIKITDGGKVAFFSLEMSAEQLATRILAEQTRISGDKMRKAEFSKNDFNKIAKTSSELEKLNLIIDDNPVLTIPTLRARARRLKRLHNINLIIIDYLQLMSSSSNNRNDGRVQEISEITRGLKSIAKELNIPFEFPSFWLNKFSVKAFNWMYYNRVLKKTSKKKVHFDDFFYPLDRINNWNRIYGKNGFTQYQFILPLEKSYEGMTEILNKISESGKGSFLAVLKLYGNENKNYLSFRINSWK